MPTIAQEFAKLRDAAQQLFIAPGVPLARLLFTHPSELHSKRIYAKLRAAAARWPTGSEPQADLLKNLSHPNYVGRCRVSAGVGPLNRTTRTVDHQAKPTPAPAGRCGLD